MSLPAFCIVGWANSGKTTLIEGLLRQLTAQGMRVGVIKHTHHPLPEDEAGKDTARFQAAGAATVTLANSEGALTREAGDKRLTELLSRVRDVDLILIEGFEKQACLPMIEVWRDPAHALARAMAARGGDGVSLPRRSARVRTRRYRGRSGFCAKPDCRAARLRRRAGAYLSGWAGAEHRPLCAADGRGRKPWAAVHPGRLP